MHNDILITASDAHYISYSNWTAGSDLRLGIDWNSDGVIDETTSRQNEAVRVFLPLISR